MKGNLRASQLSSVFKQSAAIGGYLIKQETNVKKVISQRVVPVDGTATCIGGEEILLFFFFLLLLLFLVGKSFMIIHLYPLLKRKKSGKTR